MTPSMVEILNVLEAKRDTLFSVEDLVKATFYGKGAVNSAVWRLLALKVIERRHVRRNPGKAGGARYAYVLPAKATSDGTA